LLAWTSRYLEEKGFEDPRLNAELLLAGVLGLKRLDLYLQFDRPLRPEELGEFKARLRRRLRHEPLQYIGGSADFREVRLEVDRRVLIPRPETEVLVGEVLAWCGGRPGLAALDVGTGSGAIALSLAVEGDFERIVATDLSDEALALARENGERVSGEGQVEFRLGAGYDPVEGERFDVIVSNPPYVAERERADLPPEVGDWEPHGALFAAEDGLAVIRTLVAGAPHHLRPRGLLALEIGASQAEAVVALIRSRAAFEEPHLRRDLAGRDRIVLAELAAAAAEGTDGRDS
jgi:release factor glutamine methyltransferase